jgi:hypothetical protein
MHLRAQLSAGIAAALISLVGCNFEKKEASPEPAQTNSAPVVAPATAAPPPAEDPDKAGAPTPSQAEKTGEDSPAASAKAPPEEKSKTTTVAKKGEKEVKTDGKNVELKNESGKGSMKSGPGGTTVTGKSGKSVTIPGY